MQRVPPCYPSRTCIWMPHLRIRHCITFSEVLFWLSNYGWRRAFFENAVEDGTVEIPARLLDTKIPHWFRFGDDPFVVITFLRSLRIGFRAISIRELTSEQLWELKKLMLNTHRRWFHWWRRRCPLVKMSASWFLESTYLIWILGSKLIVSKNQSRATLRVLETCLRVGLLPLMTILITTSLSSKMYNIALFKGRIHARRNKINIPEFKMPLRNLRVTLWVHSLLWCFTVRRVAPCLREFLFLIWVWMHHINKQIPEIKRGNSVHS